MPGESIQYRFADCVLDTASRTLLRHQQPVEVQNLVFDLLHYLVRHPEQVISKETLLEQVWDNQYLTDATIAQAVKKARIAVGDDGQKQAVIRTIHSKGISLVVPVEMIEPTAEKAAAQTISRRPWFVLALVLLLPLVWWLADQPDDLQAGMVSMVVFPFENATGDDEYQWLEYGLAETTSLLLEQAGGITVRHPDISADLPEGELGQRTAILGAAHGLTATISLDADQFAVTWSLANGNDSMANGSLITADASTIARLLTQAILAEVKRQPIAPISSLPLLNDSLAVELYSRGTQALYQDDREMAVALLTAAQARVPESLSLQIAVAMASFDPSQIEQSMQQLTDMLAAIPENASAERARLAYEIGDEFWYAGNIDQASQLLEQVVAAEPADELLLARALNSLSFVRQSQSTFDQAWEYAKQAEVLLRDIHDPYHLSQVLTNLGYLAEDLGRIIEAGQYHQQALDIRERYGFPSLIAASQYGLARIYRRSGEFAQAAGLLKQSLETVTRLEIPYDQFDNLEELAEVRLCQQQFDQASELIARARGIADSNDDKLGQAWSDQVSVRVVLRRGEATQQAFEQIANAIKSLQQLGERQDALIAQLELAQLLLLADRDEEAQILLSETIDAGAMDNPVLQLRQRLIAASLLAKQRNAAAALPEYLDIVRSAREIGVLDVEAEAAIDAGHLALAADDIGIARRMLAIARAWSSDYYRTLSLDRAIANSIDALAAADT